MKNVAIITDSNSGITPDEADKLGITVVPMPFYINEQIYYEDINLSQAKFYELLSEGAIISTSQPEVGTILDIWDNMLKSYNEIVYIPMSSGFSGSYETGRLLAENYQGRVLVVNNQRISVTQRQSVINAVKMTQMGMDGENIKNTLEKTKHDFGIYIMVNTLEYLKRGGRISQSAAAIGSIFNIKPVLQIKSEKIDAYSKARSVKQAKQIMIKAIIKDIENRFADRKADKSIWIYCAYTFNSEQAEEFMEEIKLTLPGYSYYMAPLPLSIACHTGPGALGIGCEKMLMLNQA